MLGIVVTLIVLAVSVASGDVLPIVVKLGAVSPCGGRIIVAHDASRFFMVPPHALLRSGSSGDPVLLSKGNSRCPFR